MRNAQCEPWTKALRYVSTGVLAQSSPWVYSDVLLKILATFSLKLFAAKYKACSRAVIGLNVNEDNYLSEQQQERLNTSKSVTTRA